MITNIKKSMSNLLGWSTRRHIIVFESDDWGSIRTRSKADYNLMRNAGLDVDNSIFPKYDCLESNDDLERLFDLLSRHKDSTDRPVVFTPMCIVANPDFDKIRENGYQKYYFEPIQETCKRYPNHNHTIQLWGEGIEKRLFVPALHGREHLNYLRWMENLQNEEGMRIAFEHQSIGVTKYRDHKMQEYLGAFKSTHRSDLPMLSQVVLDAGELFESICGYKPTHFIAPNAEPAYGLDFVLSKIGVKYITNAKIRRPDLGEGKSKIELVWLGKYYKSIDIVNIVRNGAFEQVDPNHDYVNECLYDINNAFKFHKPCIISTHRVNYIGGIDEKNATDGLKKLDILLREISKRWPDVEYMTSTELGETIRMERRL